MNRTSSPGDVVRHAYQLMADQCWFQLASCMDPDTLREHYDFRVSAARESRFAEPISMADAFLDDDMPAEVRAYMKEQFDALPEIDPFGDLLRTKTPEDLEDLTPEELFAEQMEAHDQRRRQLAWGDGMRPGWVPPEVDRGPHKQHVVGAVIDGETAHVVCSEEAVPPRPSRVHLVTLRWSNAGWRIVTGEFFVPSQEHEAYPLPARSKLAVQQLDWLERRFDHQIEPERFPGILERFRGAPMRVNDLTVPAALRTFKPPGKWSMQEHLGHLIDLEQLGEQRLADFIARADTLTAADLSNRRTHEAMHNQGYWLGMCTQFAALRLSLVRNLEALPRGVLAHRALHPRLQRPMNVADWVYFMCEHDDHHLARMRALIMEVPR